MNPEEQAYDAAGEALVDWVDTHQHSVDGPLLCTLMLDKALSLCFHCLGPEQAMKAVDELMREQIREHSEDTSQN